MWRWGGTEFWWKEGKCKDPEGETSFKVFEIGRCSLCQKNKNERQENVASEVKILMVPCQKLFWCISICCVDNFMWVPMLAVKPKLIWTFSLFVFYWNKDGLTQRGLWWSNSAAKRSKFIVVFSPNPASDLKWNHELVGQT